MGRRRVYEARRSVFRVRVTGDLDLSFFFFFFEPLDIDVRESKFASSKLER